jgi:endonuclease III
MNPEKRRKIYERLRAANPHPTTELKYSTPFELLVAVVLSAQATDKSVNLATAKFFPITPEKIVKLGVPDNPGKALRRGAAEPRSAGRAAGCRPQDR